MLGQVLKSVKALHGVGYAHRNIKPSNILQREKQHDWMLFDFSASCPVGVHLMRCSAQPRGNCRTRILINTDLARHTVWLQLLGTVGMPTSTLRMLPLVN